MSARNKKIQVVTSEDEYSKFQEYAAGKGVSMSEILRDYVKILISDNTKSVVQR